jgi:Zn-finger protein
MKHYVEIIERKSGTVSKRIDCHDQHDADKIELVLNKQLDHENFFVRSFDQKELFK